MTAIPKIVHIAWNDKTVLNHTSPLILNGLRNLSLLNPNWSIEISDDQDIDNYLRDQLSNNDYKLIEHKHIVEKSDLWRLFKMYNQGGLYVDIDRFCNIQLDSLLNDDNIMVFLPTCLDNDFSQDIMFSAPNNPIYLQTIQLILERRHAGHESTYLLGPQTFMHAVTKVLCGEYIDTNPGIEVFNEIRNIIASTTFIKTYRENPPYDTLIYKYDPTKFNLGNKEPMSWNEYKKDFYLSNGIGHWSWTPEQLKYELDKITKNSTTV